MGCAEYITVDGQIYTRINRPQGKRAVVVVDRGWIFAGDVEEKDGRIKLTSALWVFRWESVGFAAVVEDPKKAKADIRKIADVDIPKASEIFRIPVSDTWGL